VPAVELEPRYADASTLRRASAGVTMGMLSKELRSSRSLSPGTIRSTCVARARASKHLIVIRIAADRGWQRRRSGDFGECLNLSEGALARGVRSSEDAGELGAFDHFGQLCEQRRAADERDGAVADALEQSVRLSVPEQP
jgi:hypothetical protein